MSTTKDGRIIMPCGTTKQLPTCNPNLMPFHIKYTGPAAMSMFFHVEKMKPEEEKGEGEEVKKEQNDKKEVEKEEEKEEEKNPVQDQKPPPKSTLLVSSETSNLKDTDKRFISSFRGRTIHGLNVDVPTGYTGLLLHADDDDPSPQCRRVLNTPYDDDNDFDMDQETPLLRKLIPQSTFSSITLWHSDRAVDETRDDYYRTLTEWMTLSHEVSKTFFKMVIYVLLNEILKRFIERTCNYYL